MKRDKRAWVPGQEAAEKPVLARSFLRLPLYQAAPGLLVTLGWAFQRDKGAAAREDGHVGRMRKAENTDYSKITDHRGTVTRPVGWGKDELHVDRGVAQEPGEQARSPAGAATSTLLR